MQCLPDMAHKASPYADGAIRDGRTVPIVDDAREHSLFESGFEVVSFRRASRLRQLLSRLRDEGLSGVQSPAAAVAGGLDVRATITRAMASLWPLSMNVKRTEAAEDAIASLLSGWSPFALRDADFVYSLRCSGFIVRRAGPNLSAPLEVLPSWDGSGAVHVPSSDDDEWPRVLLQQRDEGDIVDGSAQENRGQ